MKQVQKTFPAAFLVIFIFGAITTRAQSQVDENALERSSNGSISGRVVNQSGQPLANALVTIRSYGSMGSGRTATTDSGGNFEVSGLTPLAYLVSASFPSYVAAPRDPDVNPIGYYRVGEVVTLEMLKGGVITGTVKGSNGEPVVSAIVRAYMIRDYKGQPSRYGAPARSSPTDDRGIYRIYGLASGTYIVAAGGFGFANGYMIDAYGDNVPTFAPSSTRDNASEIAVNGGEETANVDIRYRDEPGHTVSGTVVAGLAADQPNGINITLSSIFNGASQFSYSTYQPPGSRGFAFSGVADGDYDVIAQSFLPGGDLLLSEPRRIKVKGADVSGIELSARPLASMSGTVVLEDSKAPECQGKRRPVFGETVISPWHNEKMAAKDQPAFVWGLGGPTYPDQSGRFTLRNLAAGQYRFNTWPMAKYWYLKSIAWPASSKTTQANQPLDAARNWTTVRAGDRLSGLAVTFAAGAASLRGQLDLAKGEKLPPRLFVYLVPAERENSENVVRYTAVLASDDASFVFGNLAPGRYWIVADAAGASDTNIVSKLRLPDENDFRARLLHAGQTANHEVELKPCQNLADFHLQLKAAGQ
jgi:hypothetical protein